MIIINGEPMDDGVDEPLQQCPWCGLTVLESDDCDQPVDYCHHDVCPTTQRHPQAMKGEE